MMTWHEDREITPGVPDLHYVMGDSHRVGWLELKSVQYMSNGIKVEPSQHQYFRRWCKLMPIHFLVRIGEHVFLIPGEHHDALARVKTLADIFVLKVLDFPQDMIGQVLPPYLDKITRI